MDNPLGPHPFGGIPDDSGIPILPPSPWEIGWFKAHPGGTEDEYIKAFILLFDQNPEMSAAQFRVRQYP